MDNIRVTPALSMLIVAGVFTTLIGCTSETSRYQKTEYQMASNPAAVYCVQQDGKLDTVSENAQRVTYCVLPDGTRTEQWDYYRKNHQQSDTASK